MKVKDLKFVIKHCVQECLDELDLKSIIRQTIQEMLMGGGTSMPSASPVLAAEQHKKQTLFGQMRQTNEPVAPSNPSQPYNGVANQHERQTASFLADSMKGSHIGKQFGIKTGALREALMHTAETTLQEVKKSGDPVSAMATRHSGGDRVPFSLEEMFDEDVINRWATAAEGKTNSDKYNVQPKKQQQKPTQQSLRERHQLSTNDDEENYEDDE